MKKSWIVEVGGTGRMARAGSWFFQAPKLKIDCGCKPLIYCAALAPVVVSIKKFSSTLSLEHSDDSYFCMANTATAAASAGNRVVLPPMMAVPPPPLWSALLNFRSFFRRKNSPSFEDNFMWSLSIDVGSCC